MSNGLKQRIQSAATPSEIDYLLQESKTYRDAAPDTRRKWLSSAEKRRATLAEMSKPRHKGRAA